MADVSEFLGTEFDIFARKPKQASTDDTTQTVYKTISQIDQTDLEYLIPADNETYVDPNIKLYVSGRFVHLDGSALAPTEYTTGTNNLLHSLFSQCTISLNGIQITQSAENYPFRAYIETKLTYGSDASDSNLKCHFGKWALGT
jgi:poly(A) polymerase Pap1